MKIISSLWDEPVELDELEVHFSPDDLGRAAIVRRSDGLLCIYAHWKASDELHRLLTGRDEKMKRWRDDTAPLEELYRDHEPEIGLYGELEDARREIPVVLHLDSSHQLLGT